MVVLAVVAGVLLFACLIAELTTSVPERVDPPVVTRTQPDLPSVGSSDVLPPVGSNHHTWDVEREKTDTEPGIDLPSLPDVPDYSFSPPKGEVGSGPTIPSDAIESMRKSTQAPYSAGTSTTPVPDSSQSRTAPEAPPVQREERPGRSLRSTGW